MLPVAGTSRYRSGDRLFGMRVTSDCRRKKSRQQDQGIAVALKFRAITMTGEERGISGLTESNIQISDWATSVNRSPLHCLKCILQMPICASPLWNLVFSGSMLRGPAVILHASTTAYLLPCATSTLPTTHHIFHGVESNE